MVAYLRHTDFDGTYLFYLLTLSMFPKLCHVFLILSLGTVFQVRLGRQLGRGPAELEQV